MSPILYLKCAMAVCLFINHNSPITYYYHP